MYMWRVSSQNALYPFWSIWDIWDLSCWNIKKIIRKFVILLIITPKYSFIYNEQCIIRKVLFCIIRWCPYFKKCQKWRLTRFAIKLFMYILKRMPAFIFNKWLKFNLIRTKGLRLIPLSGLFFTGVGRLGVRVCPPCRSGVRQEISR